MNFLKILLVLSALTLAQVVFVGCEKSNDFSSNNQGI
jgi:hypothetical protein